MIGSVQLFSPALSRLPLSNTTHTKCTLTKQGHRFLTKLASSGGDPTATKNLIRRFVEGSPKFIALTTLSHLLSPDTTHPHLSSIALPLYARISEASWFNWNPKIVAELAAMLDKQGRFQESEMLISEAISRLQSYKRELALFHCKLIESYSKQNLERGFDDTYSYLDELLHTSSSNYIKRRVYEYMVSGLCTMGRPREAENLVDDMRTKGLEPSAFQLRCIIYGYGRLGLFQDLERIVNQTEEQEFVIDTVCSNMILSSYGIYGDHKNMVRWFERMRNSSIPFSIRTYNSVLNSCPTIMNKLKDLNGFPLSIKELNDCIKGDEAMVMRELVGSCKILEEVMVWDSSEAKLDLHGLHLGSCYLIMLLWLEDMERKLNDLNYEIPAQVVVVCGSGKHSNVRGESSVKGLVKEMMLKLRSPLRVDRKNSGCFVAKGKVVKDWLSKLMNRPIK
ncbi:hypothetical protein L6164_004718 [Bauhinia variegata]|uniref:Uncharacterized protein n=1 Tax=Bauhinia variegata TaxID=167791 RepID=A0ACB9PP40_BAUVA|nr:hypothetical protein L6164_004718 [Bauhinia variegata]